MKKDKVKNWLIGYAHPLIKTYKPTINRKRQVGLFSLMLADIILPATFGVGFIISNLITKYRPLFLYT